MSTRLDKEDLPAMSSIQQLHSSVDWFDATCQRLEALRLECAEYEKSGEQVPPGSLFEKAKLATENLRLLAGFPPNLPVADAWIGPECELGLTWEFGAGSSIDLVFAPEKLAIRHTKDLTQQTIEPSQLPSLLAKLSA